MPLIQVSSGDNPRTRNYVEALSAVGAGSSAGFCPLPDLSCGGLLLCGGGDIDPARYHEPNAGSFEINLARDTAEFALIEAFLAAKKPIFGICRGFQIINVALGGSMVQHMAESARHTSGGGPDLVHPVQAEADSIVGRLFGRDFSVNSSHHQALAGMGRGLIPTAWSENGAVVEAYEHESLPVFGVQWHPERMCLKQKRGDTVDALPLFAYFVSLCAK